MARSLLPRSMLNLPMRFPSFWDLEDQGDENLTQGGHPGLTISEDGENVIIEADMPGLRQEDIEISLERGILWLKGERQKEEQDKEKKYYSRATQSFSYRIAIPGQIDDAQEPKAIYKDGILKITFKKQRQSTAKKIKIQKQ